MWIPPILQVRLVMLLLIVAYTCGIYYETAGTDVISSCTYSEELTTVTDKIFSIALISIPSWLTSILTVLTSRKAKHYRSTTWRVPEDIRNSWNPQLSPMLLVCSLCMTPLSLRYALLQQYLVFLPTSFCQVYDMGARMCVLLCVSFSPLFLLKCDSKVKAVSASILRKRGVEQG